MSLRGVRQLRELVIRYSDYDGSSKGIRNWMSKYLVAFAEKNPKLQITAEKVRCKHPFLRGNYANGNAKTVCIKNADDEEIAMQILHLRNQIGRKMGSTGYKKPVISKTPSIQGHWHERMDLNQPLTVTHRFSS